jgi:hypothetical protein
MPKGSKKTEEKFKECSECGEIYIGLKKCPFCEELKTWMRKREHF